MKLYSFIRGIILTGFAIVVLGGAGILVLRVTLSRTREFKAQAKAGQPLVAALEEYRKQEGAYPQSLTNLVPRYLPICPELADSSHPKLRAWDYEPVVNGAAGSYTLQCYMGRGGIEYVPPTWFGYDEGHKEILFSNDNHGRQK